MESVTLGAVGDSTAGKTLLLVSYTSNYVYKDYKPTVLNCYWTNALVDGVAVDLRVWDNSGSTEYKLLRPLSYPQTDVFLICFSLKSRITFENVKRKWIPELKAHVQDPAFLLVGCKRDDCLMEAHGPNVISTDEAERLAIAVGAVKYVETSAMQQSGFTDCFESAIRKALERKRAKFS